MSPWMNAVRLPWMLALGFVVPLIGLSLPTQAAPIHANGNLRSTRHANPLTSHHAVSTQNTGPFGFSSDNQTTYTLATYCPQMAQAGLTWIRGFPTFNVIEPTQGKFDWSAVDAMIATATAHKITISGLLFYNAPWISSANGNNLPVADLTAWSAYVTATVTHAKASVKYWEVWNETPNFIGTGTAADYARTVVAAYAAAKKADPHCQIGLSIQSVNVNWIQQVIKAGAKDHFDYIAVHPYEVLDTVVADAWEPQFMSIVGTLHKMLAAQDPARANAPIWFTEIGRDAETGEGLQADALIKAFTMGIAQGVVRVDWFEGKDGDSGPMGLITADSTPRLAYKALTHLTQVLGATPKYEGWVLLNNRDYGFVFDGASTTVLVTWAHPRTTDSIGFGANVAIMDPRTGNITHANTSSLTSAPIFVVGVPTMLLAQARTNRRLPFPWGGDYTHASSVSTTMGTTNLDKGLHQLSANVTSTPVTVYGGPARDCGKSASQNFTVDPNFLSYTTVPITITAVLRRDEANDNAGFNLWYESTTGWKSTGGWYTIPGNTQWHKQTWTITDPQFVGKWGVNFSFNADIPRKYYLQSVTVSRVK